ncbi:MAG TPA: CDP-alcohol phosphatidyltransferase family protein [Myxococcales bacterium]|nr:CDP-alcohol phosphatidyltransferase family protein [Myxococcales bacterium]
MNLNVPNSLTGLRLVAVPVFLWLFLSGRIGAALAVFIFAMITDWLDGIAARMLKQFTHIGAVLDPIADKVMGLSAMAVLCGSHRLPSWLLWLLIFREVCIFSAIGILTRTGRSYAIRPTRFGKYSTAFLAVTIIFALVQGARDAALGPTLIVLSLISAQCIFISWAQYLAIFIDLMRRPPQAA